MDELWDLPVPIQDAWQRRCYNGYPESLQAIINYTASGNENYLWHLRKAIEEFEE